MKGMLAALLIITSLVVSAQQRPFSKEINAFKTADSTSAPPKGATVFVGSSSFRMWKDVQQDFPGVRIINRGFGGSSLPHVIDYADEIIIPYKPRQVVVYCGENDFTVDSVTSELVAARFEALFNVVRSELPRAKIIFVSMKPSPSRRHLMPKIKRANELIRDFLAGKRRTAFVDIWDAMLDAGGEPRRELFLKDMLHMNEQGYDIWQKAIAPHLKK